MNQLKWEVVGHNLGMTTRKNNSSINNWKHIFEIYVLNPSEILVETSMMGVTEPLQDVKPQYG